MSTKDCHRGKTARVVLWLMLVACIYSSTRAQRDVEPVARPQESPKDDVRVKPGKLVARGQNAVPTGSRKLLTYKLEEVELPEPVEIEIRGKKEQFPSALRLTVSGEQVMGSYVIWVDDASVPGVWLASPTEIAAFIYDRSILRDGAVISVIRDGEVHELPERLKLPKDFKAATKQGAEEGNSYSIRSALRVIGAEKLPLVEIEFRTSRMFPVTNNKYVVQIGKRGFARLRFVPMDPRSAILSLTHDEFRQIENGEPVAISAVGVVNYAAGGGPGVYFFGPLSKSLLDR